ncbi:hypothetical protein JB92DRAFT_3103716 [Gautieria morchelliformis]|nr:hypothetical protein JB92DRAFT_3103716 [Gautieria morchelliformis]
MQNNGACKHLWALRLSIPLLTASKHLYPSLYAFRYPVKEDEAREIYQMCFGDHQSSTGPGSASNAQLTISQSDKHEYATVELHMVSNQENAWLRHTMEELHVEMLEQDTTSSDSEDGNNGINPNLEGVGHQVYEKLNHLAWTFLPQLYGMETLLDEAKVQQGMRPLTGELTDLVELQVVCSKLVEGLNHITGQCPLTTDAGCMAPNNSNALFHRTSLEALPRKQLLPPSPECKQCRKTSNGVY